MRRFLAALGCLTIIPVGPRIRQQDCSGSWIWFPVVGLLLGVALAGVQAATSRLFQPPVAWAVVLLAWIILTGALHLDGFGDVCDGLYGGRTPEDRLRIMKDPHVGAMAVVGLSTLLLMKWALLSNLSRTAVMPALLLAPCLGRYAMALLGTTLPYARSAGTAEAFVRNADPRAWIGTTIMTAVASWLIAGPEGLGLLVASVAGVLIFRAVFHHALGGVTGDALGATGESIELLVLLMASIG